MNRIIYIFLITILLTADILHSFDLIPLKKFHGANAPKSVEISPDGTCAAIMNLEGLDFWIIDTSSLTFIKKVKFFPEPAKGWDYEEKKAINSYAQKPVECCFSGDSRFLWLSLHNAGAVVVYDLLDQLSPSDNQDFERVEVKNYISNTSTITRIIKIKTGDTPKVVKLTPDEKYALVSNWHSHSISVIDVEQFKNIKNISMKGKIEYIPRGIAISPDSQKAYIANMRGGTISTVDLNTLKVIDDSWVTPNPRHIVITKNGKYLYISDNIGGKVIKYDIESKRKIAETFIGEKARTIAISPDERYIFAASYKDEKIVVLKDLEIVYEVNFPTPIGLSITPDGSQLWVTSYKEGFVQVYAISY